MENISRGEKVQAWLNQIKSYQKNAPEFHNLSARNSDLNFSIAHYFDILKKLALEKGWTADCLYLQDRLGGGPLIISYPESKKNEYKKIVDKINNNELDNSSQASGSENIVDVFLNYDDVDNYLNHVRLDKSEESYLQFVILAVLGAQFALFWHALYNDQEFVCTPEKAEKIINRINRSYEDMDFIEDDLFEEKFKNIDFEPKITVKEDKVQVRLVFFTKWGGFTEAKYQVKKTFPHKIIEEETKTLIDYNCGYLY